jgi:hypothetical protein
MLIEKVVVLREEVKIQNSKFKKTDLKMCTHYVLCEGRLKNQNSKKYN